MKALVLAAGKGTRMRPVTDQVSKPLLPLRGRPTLYYILEDLINSGVTEIGIVVSDENSAQIKEFISMSKFKLEKNIEVIVQKKQLGVAHAVKTAKYFLDNQDFILYLGDNLFQSGVKQIISSFLKKDNTTIAIKEVNDPSKFGVAVIDSLGNLAQIIEKPDYPPSKYAVSGIYCFKSGIFSSIDKLNPSKRGEYEITDAIEDLLNNNINVNAEIIDGWWIDTGNLHDFLIANQNIYKSNKDSKLSLKFNYNNINSSVADNSLIKNQSNIIDSSINNFSSVGDRVTVENSNIDNCVLMDGCKIINIDLKNCLVGPNSILKSNLKDKKIIKNKIIL